MIKKIKEKLFKKREKRKESVIELLCSVLSCWFISVGACLILDSQFTIQIGIKSILWQTLLTVVASLLVTRKWWIPIIYFGILVPVFFLAIVFSGDIYTFFESVAGFFKWWISGMPINSSWYSSEGFYLIHTFTNVGVGILFFAVSRITKRAWATVILAFIFIIVNYAYGYTGYDILAVPFFIVGIFPLIAAEKFQKIKLPEIKNRFGVLGKKWLLMLVSTFMAIIVSLVSLGLLSTTEGSVRTRFCSDIVADFQTASDTFTKEQRKLNLSLFDLGLVMNSTYIGGNLYEIQSETLATTTLTETALVKMTSFDTFNGKMWVNDFEKSYRINGLWDEEQNTYLATRLIENQGFMDEVENVGYKTTVTITLKDDMNFLPTVGQVLSFEENTSTQNPILFDRRGRLISYYGQQKDYTYTCEVLIYDTTQEIVETQMNGVLDDYAFEQDPQYNPQSEFYKIYTQGFENLPKSVKSALEGLNLENKNEYEKAVAIARFFSKQNGFIYTDKTPTFVKGDSVIEKLFETKKGHCMYYATAMVAMAREAGIPSRLAAGYRTVPSADKKTQNIDACSPYAWVECYLPNIGWVAFDPSPEVKQTPMNSGGNSQALGHKSDKADLKVDTETKEEEKRVAGTHLKWTERVNIPLLTALGIAALLIVLIILNTLLSQRFYRLKSVRKRYPSTRKQAVFYYSDILRQFRWLGFRFKKGETISELALRVCAKIDSSKADIVVGGIKVVEALNYGDVTPTDEDIDNICNARQTLENILKDKNNRFLYVIKRRLLLPVFSPAILSHSKKM